MLCLRSDAKKGLSLPAMLVKDPVRFGQVVYNTTQIVLCSYMVSEQCNGTTMQRGVVASLFA